VAGTVRVRRVYAEPEPGDGTRVLVDKLSLLLARMADAGYRDASVAWRASATASPSRPLCVAMAGSPATSEAVIHLATIQLLVRRPATR
jgi:hypothetical protein